MNELPVKLNQIILFLFQREQVLWELRYQILHLKFRNILSNKGIKRKSVSGIRNAVKRISVGVASIIIFQIHVRLINALEAAIVIIGTFFYSQIKIKNLEFEEPILEECAEQVEAL
ncbi:glucose-6-phosphate/phosphate translocator 1, chloroplastic-like isoform X2 [Nicotiana tomentosiformis]|nr:PREDICTED: glucose-6-phosphate/phosphate translocator 1, chloroplastic-like isoform X2 [Nicotiana tabacum]